MQNNLYSLSFRIIAMGQTNLMKAFVLGFVVKLRKFNPQGIYIAAFTSVETTDATFFFLKYNFILFRLKTVFHCPDMVCPCLMQHL